MQYGNELFCIFQQWISDHWTNIVTWLLVVVSIIVSIVIYRLNRTWGKRNDSYRTTTSILNRIEERASQYWLLRESLSQEQKRRLEIHIKQDLDTLEDELSTLDSKDLDRSWDDELIALRQAVTGGVFESCALIYQADAQSRIEKAQLACRALRSKFRSLK